MQPLTLKQALLTVLLLTACTITAAQGTKEYRSPNDVDLPPIEQRKIIGTWLTKPPPGSCTRSFEAVRGKVYNVVRCSDGSGGKTGQVIAVASPKKFLSPTSTTGDYYLILQNGDLSVRDKDGEIEVEPKHSDLWPSTTSKAPPQSNSEDAKTLGLGCYEVGYRYGYTSTSSMKGKRINLSWNFATPERCRNDSDMQRGILAGTRAAW